MTTAFFSTVRPSKILPIGDFISNWQDFYGSYNIPEESQNIETGLKGSPKAQAMAKSSFRKIKRSKTLDMSSFFTSIEGIYSENTEDPHKANSSKSNSIPLHMRVKFCDDQSKGENSMDFSSLDTAITPLRELKIEETSTFTPFIVKESPRKIGGNNDSEHDPIRTALIKDLRNTQRRADRDEQNGNKETRKYSMKKGLLKKNTNSSRILKFD